MIRIRNAIRPSMPLGINRGSPQAKGLTHCYGRYQNQLLFDVMRQDSVGLQVMDPVKSTQEVGHAALFGVGDFIDLGLSADAALGTAPCTWVSWLYPVTLGANEDSETWWSFGTSTGSIYNWYVSVGGGTVNFYSNAAGNFFKGTDPIIANQWNMAAFAAGTNDRRVSANGRPWQGDSGSTATTGDPSNLIYYGRRVDGFGAPSFIGYLAELRRYNYVLSDAELAVMYDPMTRWDLYNVPNRQFFDILATAPIIPSLAWLPRHTSLQGDKGATQARTGFIPATKV